MMKNFFGLKILIAIIVIAVSVSATSIFLYSSAEANSLATDATPKAVIIDQLDYDIPNKDFHLKATEFLESAGYKVDIFTTKDITVDFYKKLPTLGYKFIVIRSHGAANSNDDTVTLFTGEKYNIEKYTSEQLFGQIKKGSPILEVTLLGNTTGSQFDTDSNWDITNDTYRTITIPANEFFSSDEEYFVITPTFVDSAMEGKFSQTTIILGGCKTMHTDSFAQSLVKRGASSVVGWDDQIGAFDNDAAMLKLLEELLVNKMEMQDAVDSSMKFIPPFENMAFPARMKIYS
jgi:hypothetical protein